MQHFQSVVPKTPLFCCTVYRVPLQSLKACQCSHHCLEPVLSHVFTWWYASWTLMIINHNLSLISFLPIVLVPFATINYYRHLVSIIPVSPFCVVYYQYKSANRQQISNQYQGLQYLYSLQGATRSRFIHNFRCCARRFGTTNVSGTVLLLVLAPYC